MFKFNCNISDKADEIPPESSAVEALPEQLRPQPKYYSSSSSSSSPELSDRIIFQFNFKVFIQRPVLRNICHPAYFI
jgi:hypothetical protein